LRSLEPIGLWLKLTLLSAFLLFVVFCQGVFASGKDIDETCEFSGQEYDEEYRLQHAHELSRLFPLTNPCNAFYDTVPAWANPALVVLAILTVSFFGAAVASVFIRVKSRL
jgi:hypothetical protein